MPQIIKNIGNSKLLAEATRETVSKLDDGSSYQVQLSFTTRLVGGLSCTQVETFLNKCRQSLGQFKDDLELKDINIIIDVEVPELKELEKEFNEKAAPYVTKLTKFNQELTQGTHQYIIDKLGLNSGQEEAQKAEVSEAPKAAAGEAKS